MKKYFWESRNSCPQTPEPSCSEATAKRSDTPKSPLSESESSTEPSMPPKALLRPNTSSMRLGSRPQPQNSSDKIIGVSSKGVPVGEYSPRAKYTDKEIDEVFMLRDEGYSFGEIGKMLDMPKQTAWAVYVGRIRARTVDKWKRRK